MSNALEKCDPRSYNLLFAEDVETYRNDSVDNIAELVSEGLICVSNRFDGIDDPAWTFALDVLGSVFERFGDTPIGFSPLQQAVAIRLVEKLKRNMDGYYPTLSRVLLAVIGPYETNAPERPGSAAAILKDAVYCQLKRLPELYEKDPVKVSERLPPNVVYDHTSRSLTHTYTGGTQVKTALESLLIEEVNLIDEKYLRRRA